MNWGSWDAFWAMGGYGLYVWGSYAVAVAVQDTLAFVAAGGDGLRVVAPVAWPWQPAEGTGGCNRCGRACLAEISPPAVIGDIQAEEQQ